MTSEDKTKYEWARNDLIKKMMERITEINRQPKLPFITVGENGFNQNIYEKLKTAYIVVYNNIKDSITDLPSFASALIRFLHREFDLRKELIYSMKPYLSRFIEQVSNDKISLTELPPHLSPMKIEVFRKLSPKQQAKHKQIAKELAKRLIQEIAKGI
jgi:hypothetical protein